MANRRGNLFHSLKRHPRQNQIVPAVQRLYFGGETAQALIRLSARRIKQRRRIESCGRFAVRQTARVDRRLRRGGNLRRRQNKPIRQRFQLRAGNFCIDRRDGVFPEPQASGIVRQVELKTNSPLVGQQFAPRRSRFAGDKHRGLWPGSIASIASATRGVACALCRTRIRARQDTVPRRATAVATTATGSIRRCFHRHARRPSRSTRSNEGTPSSRHTASAAWPRPTPWRPESMTIGQVDCESTQRRAKR